MNTISILGVGWLGTSLVEIFTKKNILVKSSSRTNPNHYLININNFSSTVHKFLSSDILIINIPSKNIDSFKNLLSFIENSPIKKVLFVSSTSVCNIHNKYTPLLEIEKLFTGSTAFDTTIIRFGGLVGYSRNPAYFFKNNKSVINANTVVNLIHKDDCVAIIEKIISQNVWGETFNACADTHPTKKEFYTYACKSANVPLPSFAESSHNRSNTISNETLKKALHYEFIHPDLMKIKF